MRKTEMAVQRCKTMSRIQKILGGKWKLEILYYIGFCDVRRFGALRRQLGEITESSLTKQLRELEPGEIAICRRNNVFTRKFALDLERTPTLIMEWSPANEQRGGGGHNH